MMTSRFYAPSIPKKHLQMSNPLRNLSRSLRNDKLYTLMMLLMCSNHYKTHLRITTEKRLTSKNILADLYSLPENRLQGINYIDLMTKNHCGNLKKENIQSTHREHSKWVDFDKQSPVSLYAWIASLIVTPEETHHANNYRILPRQ